MTFYFDTDSEYDQYAAPSPFPSYDELSLILTDDDSGRIINRRFKRRLTTSAVLRYYQHLSISITHLEEELDRHKDERRVLWEGLAQDRSFQRRFRPVVQEYRHQRALRKRGYHPYRDENDTLYAPYHSNNASNDDIHLEFMQHHRPATPDPKQEPEDIGVPIKLEDCDATANFPPDYELDGRDDDGGQGCTGCQGDHDFYECPREYVFDEEKQEYQPILDGQNPFAPRYIPDTSPSPSPDAKGKQVPCQRCFRVGHKRLECDEPIRSSSFCDTCAWKKTPQEDCTHVDPSPAFVERSLDNIARQRRATS